MAVSKSGEASLLLLAALLAVSASASAAAAARPQPSSTTLQSVATNGLARAMGLSGTNGEEPCCDCACPPIFPRDYSYCICHGSFKGGSCPAACNNCACVGGICACVEPVSFKDCIESQCPFDASSVERPHHPAAFE